MTTDAAGGALPVVPIEPPLARGGMRFDGVHLDALLMAGLADGEPASIG
jgi:hypothetical protein